MVSNQTNGIIPSLTPRYSWQLVLIQQIHTSWSVSQGHKSVVTQVARRYPRSPSGRRAPNRVWSPPAANSHHLTAVALLNTLLHCYTIAHCSSTHFTQCTLNTPYWLLPHRCQVCILIRFSCCIASHYCGKGTTQNRSNPRFELALNYRDRIRSAGVHCVNCMCRRELLWRTTNCICHCNTVFNWNTVCCNATVTPCATVFTVCYCNTVCYCYTVCYCNVVCPQPQPPWQEVLMLTLPSPLSFTSLAGPTWKILKLCQSGLRIT